MFTYPSILQLTEDAIPKRVFDLPFKQNVSMYSFTFNDTGYNLKLCPTLPLGYDSNSRTTSHVRILSQTVRYSIETSYTSQVNSPLNYGDAVRATYIIDTQCGLMSGSGSWLPPSNNTSASFFNGSRFSTPRRTTLACFNHVDRPKYAFMYDRRYDFTYSFNGASIASQGTTSWYAQPRRVHDDIFIHHLDLDVQYTNDGLSFAGQVPFISFCSDYGGNKNCDVTVSTIFIDVPDV